jgi:hypothetical protein
MHHTVPNLLKVQRRVQEERSHSTHPFLLLGTNHFDVQILTHTKTDDSINDDILTSIQNTHVNPRL